MRQFGELEAVIMDLLWSRGGSATVRDVLQDLRRGRSIAYTTVMTVMNNLHRKHLLARRMEGRAWQYQPVKTREQFTADLMVEVLEEAKDRTGTLVHLLGSEISQDCPGQAAVLDRLLDLLLVTCLRKVFSSGTDEAPRWYAAQDDPVVGKAIQLMHHNAAHPGRSLCWPPPVGCLGLPSHDGSPSSSANHR